MLEAGPVNIIITSPASAISANVGVVDPPRRLPDDVEGEVLGNLDAPTAKLNQSSVVKVLPANAFAADKTASEMPPLNMASAILKGRGKAAAMLLSLETAIVE